MTGLTANIHVSECRRVAVRGQVEILAHIGGVAVGAHIVPGLVTPCPVQRITGGKLLVGIQKIPPLPALFLGPTVPRDAECLISPVGKFDQILLKWIDTKRVGDEIFVQHAVGSVGADHEMLVGTEERRRHPEMLELCAGKIAQHRGSRGWLHRQRMVGLFPCIGFRGMAASAGLRTHESGWFVRRCRCGGEHQRDDDCQVKAPRKGHVTTHSLKFDSKGNVAGGNDPMTMAGTRA